MLRLLLLSLLVLHALAVVSDCASPSPERLYDFSARGPVDYSGHQDATPMVDTRPISYSSKGAYFRGDEGHLSGGLVTGDIPFDREKGLAIKLKVHKEEAPVGNEYLFQHISPFANALDPNYPHNNLDQLFSCRFVLLGGDAHLECIAASDTMPRTAVVKRSGVLTFPLTFVLMFDLSRPSTSTWTFLRMTMDSSNVDAGWTDYIHDVERVGFVNLTLGRAATCSSLGKLDCGAFRGYVELFVADGDPMSGPSFVEHASVCGGEGTYSPAPTPSPTAPTQSPSVTPTSSPTSLRTTMPSPSPTFAPTALATTLPRLTGGTLSDGEDAALAGGDETSLADDSGALPIALGLGSVLLLFCLACGVVMKRRKEERVQRSTTIMLTTAVSAPTPGSPRLTRSRSSSRKKARKVEPATSTTYASLVLPDQAANEYSSMPHLSTASISGTSSTDYRPVSGDSNNYRSMPGNAYPPASAYGTVHFGTRTHSYASPDTPYSSIEKSRRSETTSQSSAYATSDFGL